MITINIFFKSLDNLINSETIISNKITSIDDARILVIKYLGKHYSNYKYKLIVNTLDNKNSINVIFEDEELSIKREFLLNKILEDE